MIQVKKEGRWERIIQEVGKQIRVLEGQGIAPTLRTMHYRLVSMQVIGNTKNEYKELSKKTARAREDGRLPINCFVDQGKEVYDNKYQDDSELDEPEDSVDGALSTLKDLDEDAKLDIPKWYNQKHYLEIWIEKDALATTFIQLAQGEIPVRIVPNKGYSSLTFMWENAERLKEIADGEDKEIHIRYFGDFDPSGYDMDRDIEERLEMLGASDTDFERVATKLEHVQRYNLPPMPTDEESIRKYQNDSRREAFESEHGGSYAVELDALTVYAPEDLKQMVQDCINEFYDPEIYDKEVDERSTPEFKRETRQMVRDRVQEFLDGYDVDDVTDDGNDDDDDGGQQKDYEVKVHTEGKDDDDDDEVRRIKERHDREDGSNLYVWDQPEIHKLRAQDSTLDAIATDYNIRTQREYDEQLELKDRDWRDGLAKSKEKVGEKVWDIAETHFKEGRITELDWRILQRIRTGAPPLPLSERGKYWKAKGDELLHGMKALTRALGGPRQVERGRRRRRRRG